MKAIQLWPVLEASNGQAAGLMARLDNLATVLARIFRATCYVRADPMSAGFARDYQRNQYHSTAILQRLLELSPDDDIRVLGVTPLDLFVPVFTFVFGEAQVGGRCAIVSCHRLREEFYGLPPRPDLLDGRLVKEAVHELGHTFGLQHCDDWRCVMASSHAVERVDVKGSEFCARCTVKAGL